MESEGVLLYRDHEHISSHIHEEGGVEHTIRRRGLKIKEPNERIVYFLQRSGFYNATFLRGFKIIPGLITALIERWRPETHTFHFPFGECTITLEDVALQLGVPTNGKPLVRQNSRIADDLCLQYLDKIPPPDCVDGLRIKISWLQREFTLTDESDDRELECATRAYILQLIGGVLMPDTSGNMVHTQYLPFLENFDTTSTYSWGSAILAFLYLEMCRVAIMSGSRKLTDMGGCQILLQSWAWYRLPYLTPIVEVHVPMEFPLAGRWRHRMTNAGVVHNTVREIRLKIQTIGKDQFFWQPYLNNTIWDIIPLNFRQMSSIWGAVVPLIHFSIVEFHCADRVLRQFNYHQPIPTAPPQQIHTVHRGRFNENWIVKQAEFIQLWRERRRHWDANLSQIQADDFDFNSKYYSWFSSNGKPFIVPLEEANQWLQDPRCSRHVHLPYVFGQSSHQPNLEGSASWHSPWSSDQSQPPFGNVSEQPQFGESSSYQSAYNDDEGYVPQFQYPQTPLYGEGMTVGTMISLLSTTTISSSPLDLQGMYSTPPSMQMMGDQCDNDEQTPNQQQRQVRPPQYYDQTSSLHRQVLPRTRRK